MLETIKKIYAGYKPLFKGLFTALGIIAIFDWVIAPGLTVANTFINILSFVIGTVMILFFGLLVWDNGLKNLSIKKEKWEKTSETDGQNSNKDNENSMNKDNENLKN